MIEFQKQYLEIINQQKQKTLIMQSIFGDYLQPFNDIASFADGNFVGDTPDATASNMDNAINNVTGKLSYMKPMTDYVKEKGKALTQAFVSPIKMCKTGGNVSQKAQQNGQNAGKYAQRQSYKSVEAECKKKNIRIKGITSESIIAESTPYIKKCAKEHSREVSKFLRHCILEDAKQGITPNMWFDTNANPAEQRDIIFENTTISFKTNNGKLICEEIQNKSKKRYLISEANINKNIIILEARGDTLFSALADNIPEKFQDYYLAHNGSEASNQILIDLLKGKEVNGMNIDPKDRAKLISIVGKEGAQHFGITDADDIMAKHKEYSYTKYGKVRQPDGTLTTRKDSLKLEPKNNKSGQKQDIEKIQKKQSDISKNAQSQQAKQTDIPPANKTQSVNTSGVQNGLPSGQASKVPFADKGKFSQQKGIWAKIKWILKSIYQLIYKVIGFICQLILGLILFLIGLIPGVKQWIEGKGGAWAFARTLLQDNPVGRGVIHTFSIGAIVLAVYGIGAAIAGLFTDDQKKELEQEQPKIDPNNLDLSLISDFGV